MIELQTGWGLFHGCRQCMEPKDDKSPPQGLNDAMARQPGSMAQYAPVRLNTTFTVLNKMAMSDHSDQFLTYHESRYTRVE